VNGSTVGAAFGASTYLFGQFFGCFGLGITCSQQLIQPVKAQHRLLRCFGLLHLYTRQDLQLDPLFISTASQPSSAGTAVCRASRSWRPYMATAATTMASVITVRSTMYIARRAGSTRRTSHSFGGEGVKLVLKQVEREITRSRSRESLRLFPHFQSINKQQQRV